MRLVPAIYQAIKVPMELRTHAQQVKNLYKRSYRNLEAYHENLVQFRIEARLLRARFDDNKTETDVVKIRTIVDAAEKELYDNWHPAQLYFPSSPGGVAYERYGVTPDWVLDYWHPLERARYPEYFKRREQRKKEFLVWWEKQYGKPTPAEGAH